MTADLPSNIDELAAAADNELVEEPLRRTVARVAVAAGVAALVLVLLVVAATQWWRPGTLVHDALKSDCSHVFGGCYDVSLVDLDRHFAGDLPPGTKLVYSTRVTSLLYNRETVFFEVVLPEGSVVPDGYGPWTTAGKHNAPAQELTRRGLDGVIWSEGFAAGTNVDGTVTLRGQYTDDTGTGWD
ncbi:hypothetical protein ACLRGF_02515 [Mycetocola zhadangensis]|jgi:hypothetical protein|uniref:hypothetical protein n=1 Tax=Mycetocola zhadangensis TaxID=1164595 RepID=UPI003A4D2201